jgi:LacI family transcriptional regulator
MRLRELAGRLGLSTSTVSAALNGYPDVAARTRERVLAAARECGCTAHAAAQRLISGRAHAVGCVLPLPPGRFADAFFMEPMIGLGEALRPHGLDLVVCAAAPGAEELATGRHQRLFGLESALADGAASSATGSITPGRNGLPSATKPAARGGLGN